MTIQTHRPWDNFSLANDPAIDFHQDNQGSAWWKLFVGDCRKVLKQLPAQSVNCVVTSPPYYWQRDYNVEEQLGKEASIDQYVNNLKCVFSDVRRLLADDGTVFLNLGDTYYSAKGQPKGTDPKHQARRFGLRAVDAPGLGIPRKSMIGMPWRVALALIDDGWILRSANIWVRNTAIPEPSAKDRPWRKYEFVFLLAKKPRYFFNRASVGDDQDVWFIEPERNSRSRGTHYAPFPRELVEKCITLGCPEGGVVLDPFVGGGTTIYQSLAMGRSAVGIELNPDYCSLIRQSLEQFR